MKTNNLFIASIIFIALISCNKSQPTEQNKTYNLKEIHEDSNWVEVTDTNLLDIRFKKRPEFKELKAYVYNDSSEYNKLLNDIQAYRYPEINFSSSSMIGTITFGQVSSFEYHIKYNDSLKKYLFIILQTNIQPEKLRLSFWHWFIIPKIKTGYSVEILYNQKGD